MIPAVTRKSFSIAGKTKHKVAGDRPVSAGRSIVEDEGPEEDDESSDDLDEAEKRRNETWARARGLAGPETSSSEGNDSSDDDSDDISLEEDLTASDEDVSHLSPQDPGP